MNPMHVLKWTAIALAGSFFGLAFLGLLINGILQ
jgi:hypothetical protein